MQNKCRSTVWQVWDLYYTGSGGDYLIYEVANTGRQACQFVSEGEACGMHPDGSSHSAGGRDLPELHLRKQDLPVEPAVKGDPDQASTGSETDDGCAASW